MINRHIFFTSFFFCFSFVKEKMDGASALSISAAKLPVAGLRRQAAVGVENFYPMIYCARRRKFAVCTDDDSSTRRCCGIVWRLPQQPQSPLGERTMPQAYHRLFCRW